MKTIILVLLHFVFFSAFAQNSVRITWDFKNIEPGFDHQNKIVVFIDNQPIAESETFLESEVGTLNFRMPSSKFYKIRIVNYAWTDGEWEEHMISNKYSIDCIYEKNVKLKATKTGVLHLTFDFKFDKMKIKSKYLKTKKVRPRIKN